MLRDSINPSYRLICSQTIPIGKWLFGDELPKHVKDIVEVNKLAKNLSPHHQTHYSDHFTFHSQRPQGYASQQETAVSFTLRQSRKVPESAVHRETFQSFSKPWTTTNQ